MRTLQEKYNAIQEGKFSKEHFLAEARMQQPQLITRFNGYDDAVQILKNKGMIQEAKATLKEDSFSKVWDKSKLTKTTYADGKYHSSEKFKTVEDLLADKEKTDAIQKRREEKGKPKTDHILKEARLTNKSLTDYRYKPTNEMDKYPYEQILRGIRVELEGLGVQGTPTAEEYSKALAKVSKNLAKDSIFYTNLVAGVNTKVDLHDKMVPFTDKVKVDTFNGMKKAELKEGFKKLIKKVLSEEVMDVEDYNGEDEFDMYGDDEADDISHPRGYEDQDEMDYDEEVDENYFSNYGSDEPTAEESETRADSLYSRGFDHYRNGAKEMAEKFRQQAIHQGKVTHQGDEDFPPYESDEEDFEDLFESISLKDIL
jgi:hypothetical protein